MWSDFSSNNVSVSDRAEKQWDRNMKAYWKYIAKILPKLPSQARKFFKKTSLHDGDILSISIGDLWKNTKAGLIRKTNYAEIKAIHPESGDLYTIRYSCLRECKIEYHADKRDRKQNYFVLGDWGYDELFLTKDKWLRHEILFASDMTILLEFKHFSYEVKKLKGKNDLVGRD